MAVKSKAVTIPVLPRGLSPRMRQIIRQAVRVDTGVFEREPGWCVSVAHKQTRKALLSRSIIRKDGYQPGTAAPILRLTEYGELLRQRIQIERRAGRIVERITTQLLHPDALPSRRHRQLTRLVEAELVQMEDR